VFGRSGRVDPIEVSGPSPGFVRNTGSSGDPSVAVGKITTAKQMSMPTSNDQLADVAAAGGTVYSGKTVVRLKTGGLMDVTNYDASGAGTTTTNVPWPVNGVLYVKNNGACTGEYPTAAKYTESATCGNVYVSGTYGQSLTIAAANDVIVRPTLGGKLSNKSNDGSLIRQSGTDATLGLIANNFVRVAHPIVRNTDGSCNDNLDTTNDPVVMNVQIDAAILSLQHSFIVDNYNCGRLATLTVNGAIAQKYRGPVGTGNGANPATGFLKNYTYDDRFRYRSPPYFMNPVDASWDIIRSHEQVPAR
jgi:hypothetical protein